MGRKGKSAWLLTPSLKDADDLLADSSGSTCKDTSSSDARPRPCAGGKETQRGHRKGERHSSLSPSVGRHAGDGLLLTRHCSYGVRGGEMEI
jgi:hypothetical protein